MIWINWSTCSFEQALGRICRDGANLNLVVARFTFDVWMAREEARLQGRELKTIVIDSIRS